MKRPMRLRDDLSQERGLLDALAAEQRLPAGDLAGLKAEILAQVGAHATGATGAAGVAGAAKAAAAGGGIATSTKLIVAAVILTGVATSAVVLQRARPSAPPPRVAPAPPAAALAPAPEPAPEPALAPPPAAPAPLEAKQPASTEVAMRGAAPTEASAPPSATAGSGESSLAEQLSLYRQGQVALRAGAFDRAIEIFTQLDARYPHGELRTEGRLSLLQARVGAEQHREIAQLAAELMDIPTLAERRGEIARVRAEALLMLGQCDAAAEAYAVAVQGHAFEANMARDMIAHCRSR